MATKRKPLKEIASKVSSGVKSGKGWFKRCVKNVKDAGGAINPKKVCGAIKFNRKARK